MRVVVGTRGSPLALIQTHEVLDPLRQEHPSIEFVVREVRTQGDIAGEAPLASMPRGLFAKELELALLQGAIDMAVHSFKDLPTELAPEFAVAAISHRQDPRDVLIAPSGHSLSQLPKGARLGTSSPRRMVQLRAYRPDLSVLPIRGNVGTRVRKAQGPDFDGVVLAAAGLLRLGLEAQVTEHIEPDICIPAVGQGALAIEVREGDRRMREIAAAAEDRESRTAVAAEMSVLQRLGGGCKVPIAVYATIQGESVSLLGMVASADGGQLIRATATGQAARPEEAGALLAQRLLEQGAGALLEAQDQ